MELSDKGDLPSAESIGRILNTCKGRNLGGYILTGSLNRSKTSRGRLFTQQRPMQGMQGLQGMFPVVRICRRRAGRPGAGHPPMATTPASPASPAPEIDPFEGDDWTKFP